jgi:3-phosphoshikimate 1-carboxyvinyltransferase
MASGLTALGVPVELSQDGITVTGVERFRGGELQSFGDHRIAMAFALAALRADAPLSILDCANVETSFPGFVPFAQAAGLVITADARRAA